SLDFFDVAIVEEPAMARIHHVIPFRGSEIAIQLPPLSVRELAATQQETLYRHPNGKIDEDFNRPSLCKQFNSLPWHLHTERVQKNDSAIALPIYFRVVRNLIAQVRVAVGTTHHNFPIRELCL